ncbi:hypothetical protein [Cupriavidus basilensis]|uniref:hypothetical protein n=1 Tax=Cupriavidus basilensis TaxID=68895 RepID=UPI0020A6BE44|nr:hypothetical protein [Cupriavidus basilensis]MCP3019082.1 hypothetical protein [Cupriavidus basilensis]
MPGSAGDVSAFVLVRRLEEDLQLPTGFFQALLKEDDWSFLIKLHALFEAALSHVIVHRLGCETLSGPMSRLEMSDKDKGKIAFASALGLIGQDERRYIIQLSQLRNRCVHDVREAATFNLQTACAAMDTTQKKTFVKAICGTEGDEKYEENGRKMTRKDLVLKEPKMFVWRVGMFVLAALCLQKENEELRRERRRLMEDFFANSPANLLSGKA